MVCYQCQTSRKRSRRTETKRRASSRDTRIRSSLEKFRISIKKRRNNRIIAMMMKDRIMKIGYVKKRKTTVKEK
jgi:hypothetical protein